MNTHDEAVVRKALYKAECFSNTGTAILTFLEHIRIYATGLDYVAAGRLAEAVSEVVERV